MNVACLDSVNKNEFIHVRCAHIHVFVTTVAEIQACISCTTCTTKPKSKNHSYILQIRVIKPYIQNGERKTRKKAKLNCKRRGIGSEATFGLSLLLSLGFICVVMMLVACS
ncbi:hypothetical protein AMTRI_Chr11g98700 [Amborella trichopoda]